MARGGGRWGAASVPQPSWPRVERSEKCSEAGPGPSRCRSPAVVFPLMFQGQDGPMAVVMFSGLNRFTQKLESSLDRVFVRNVNDRLPGAFSS